MNGVVLKGKIVHSQKVEWEIKDPRTKFKFILKKEDMGPASIRMLQIKAGGEFPIEVHDESDEIGYLVIGKGRAFFEDTGEQEISPGSFWYVPKGSKHGFKRVDEDATLFCIHIPPAF